MLQESGVKNVDAACEDKLFPFQFLLAVPVRIRRFLDSPTKPAWAQGQGAGGPRYRHTWMPGLDPD